ncbi:MAG: hypothetical protein ACJ8MO_01370 [Bacillus sp. (in: firmicutes)]
MQKGNYKKVIQLCLDGEKADTEFRGLVHKWREYQLKELYQTSEWEAVLKQIVQDFEKMNYQLNVYLSILKEENLTGELLRYCQNHISSITDLYPYLIKDYLEEVNELFIKFIEYSAEEATDRKKYRTVCSLIKTYKNACGTIQSHKLI